jgi:hypothetical protein
MTAQELITEKEVFNEMTVASSAATIFYNRMLDINIELLKRIEALESANKGLEVW